MPTHLYLAPAAAGKTAYTLARARDAGRDLAAIQRAVVPAHLQARAARRRLVGAAYGLAAPPATWRAALHGEWSLRSGERWYAARLSALADRLAGATTPILKSNRACHTPMCTGPPASNGETGASGAKLGSWLANAIA